MQPVLQKIRRHHIRDLADGIYQMMYFWGQDVTHPEGNFFLSQGFERSPSTGIKGTSCYRLPWQDGHIELYGACAGWYGKDGGFAFIRPRRRCVCWISSMETPVPGAWQPQYMNSSATPEDIHLAASPFLDWSLSYEKTVLDHFGQGYRKRHYEKYRQLPKSKAWLPPEKAIRWLETFRRQPDRLTRPKDL